MESRWSKKPQGGAARADAKRNVAAPPAARAQSAVPSAEMRKASLDAARPHAYGRVRKESLTLDGVTVTRVTFGVGARWSEDVAPAAGTDRCLAPHVAIVLSGALRVRMDDGSVEDFRTNDVMLLPPGHDAWTLGDAPCVFVELSQGYDRYERGAPASAERERFG